MIINLANIYILNINQTLQNKMVISSYFKNIQDVILKELSLATSHVRIAVTWFTNYRLFNSLLELLDKGIEVELIILNDDINHRIGGLGFQSFIDKGGYFYLGNNDIPMHNKFCIIDNKILLTGSYNWTYNAELVNLENVLLFKGVSDIVESYSLEFYNITKNIEPTSSLKNHLKAFPPKANFFSYSNYASQDLYWYAKSEEEGGNNMKALNLINLSLSIQADNQIEIERREIHDVIYKMWNEKYIMEKVEIVGGKGIFHFKTTLENGGWIYGPGHKYAWILRDTINPEFYYKCSVIKNIMINDNVIVEELNGNSTLHMPIGSIPRSVKVNYSEMGYTVDADGKPIDELGNLVPIKEIKINKSDVLKCSIHFEKLSADLKRVDFIEGIGMDTHANYWHCFDIHLDKTQDQSI